MTFKPHLKFSKLFLLIPVLISGCSMPSPKPQLSHDYTLESFKTVSSWEHQEPAIIMLTMQMYSSAGRFQDGVNHFSEMSKLHPDEVLHSACEGVMMAKMADDVPLIFRIQWVNRALEKLDTAAKNNREEAVFLRGLVEVELPFFFFRKDKAIEDLKFAFDHREKLPFWGTRAIYHAFAKAYDAKGDKKLSDEYLKKAGVSELKDVPLLADGTYSALKGFRFTSPQSIQIEPNLWMFAGYDFSNIFAYKVKGGFVVIDTATTGQSADLIKAEIHRISPDPILAIIVTHAHWDHIGGLDHLIEPGTQIIARNTFTKELENVNSLIRASKLYFGSLAKTDSYQLTPSRMIKDKTILSFGGKNLELLPIASSETEDALLVFDPTTKTAIVGDVMMPYFGAPWASEGNPETLIRTVSELQNLGVRQIYSGHAPLTRYYTVDSLDGLAKGISASLPLIRQMISDGKSVSEILASLPIPEVLKRYPKSTLPYLIMREGLIQREFRNRTGYWQPEFQGVDPVSQSELASAIDLVGGESASSFAHAVEKLISRGDISLAAQIAKLGTLKYPDSSTLQQLLKQAADLNKVRNEMINPFKVVIYSEMSTTEVKPIDPNISEKKTDNTK